MTADVVASSTVLHLMDQGFTRATAITVATFFGNCADDRCRICKLVVDEPGMHRSYLDILTPDLSNDYLGWAVACGRSAARWEAALYMHLSCNSMDNICSRPFGRSFWNRIRRLILLPDGELAILPSISSWQPAKAIVCARIETALHTVMDPSNADRPLSPSLSDVCQAIVDYGVAEDTEIRALMWQTFRVVTKMREPYILRLIDICADVWNLPNLSVATLMQIGFAKGVRIQLQNGIDALQWHWVLELWHAWCPPADAQNTSITRVVVEVPHVAYTTSAKVRRKKIEFSVPSSMHVHAFLATLVVDYVMDCVWEPEKYGSDLILNCCKRTFLEGEWGPLQAGISLHSAGVRTGHHLRLRWRGGGGGRGDDNGGTGVDGTHTLR